jgi:hypothetical protein
LEGGREGELFHVTPRGARERKRESGRVGGREGEREKGGREEERRWRRARAYIYVTSVYNLWTQTLLTTGSK